MKIVATLDLILTIASALSLVGCRPVIADPARPVTVESAVASQARMVEADHRDRIIDAWIEGGVDCERKQRQTNHGGFCDIVTSTVAFELDYAGKHHEAVGQAVFYGLELDRRPGVVLLTDDDDAAYVERCRLVCDKLGILLLTVPLAGEVPVPSLPTVACTCGPKCDCDECRCGETKLPAAPAVEAKPPVETDDGLYLITADWCPACIPAKAAIPPSGVDVEIVNWDTQPERRNELFRGYPHREAGLPMWVLVKDNVPVRWWTGSTTPAGVREMLGASEAGEPPSGRAAGEGNVGPLPEPAASSAPPWAVRVLVRDRRGNQILSEGHGSGAIVGFDGSRYSVLTNRHVAAMTGEVLVNAAGRWYPAHRVKSSGTADLSLLSFTAAPGLEVLPVAESAPADGSSVIAHGFASGEVYRSQDTSLRYTTDRGGRQPHTYFTAANYCGGESGGPVVSDGRLVGLIYGGDVTMDPDGGSGLVVDHPSIVEFLE